MLISTWLRHVDGKPKEPVKNLLRNRKGNVEDDSRKTSLFEK